MKKKVLILVFFILFIFIVQSAKSQYLSTYKRIELKNNINLCSNVNQSVILTKSYNSLPKIYLNIEQKKINDKDLWFIGGTALSVLSLSSIVYGTVSYLVYKPNEAPPRRDNYTTDSEYADARADFDKPKFSSFKKGIWIGFGLGVGATFCFYFEDIEDLF